MRETSVTAHRLVTPEGGARLPAATRRRLRREIEISYRELFVCWVGRVRRKYGLSKEDAKDVVQDAFLLALVRLGKVENVRAWLEGVIDRLALDLLRTGKRRVGLLARWGRAAAPPTQEDEETPDGR